MSSGTAAAQGMMQGGAMGSAAGPWGAAIGAGLGGIIGYLGHEDQERRARKAHEKNERLKRERNRYSAFFGQRPDQMTARVSGSPVAATVSGLTQGAHFGNQMANLYSKTKTKPEPYLENVDYGRIDSAPPRQVNPYEPNPEYYSPLNSRRTMYA